MLNERTYTTPDSCLIHLLRYIATVAGGHSLTLVTPECTRGVIDPLYHSRHNGRDRQYECDRGINRLGPIHENLTFNRLSHAASALYAGCGVFAVKFQLRCSSRWLSLWFSAGSTIATVCWLGYLPTSSSDFSRLKMLQHGSSTGFVVSYDHITDAPISLHWLRVPERISFKIAVLTYRSLNGSASSYLSSYFTRVSDVPSRHRLRSASTSRLTTPFIRRSTIGKRSFPVVGADL